MTTISISQLKTNPSKALSQSVDYPVAIANRNKTQAYLIGKQLYHNLVNYLEDRLDKSVIEKTDFSQGKDFEIIAQKLGV